MCNALFALLAENGSNIKLLFNDEDVKEINEGLTLFRTFILPLEFVDGNDLTNACQVIVSFQKFFVV